MIKTDASARKSAAYGVLFLTFPQLGLALKYHLRSTSGSNGLAAKEMSPLFGNGPILISPSLKPRPSTRYNGIRHIFTISS